MASASFEQPDLTRLSPRTLDSCRYLGEYINENVEKHTKRKVYEYLRVVANESDKVYKALKNMIARGHVQTRSPGALLVIDFLLSKTEDEWGSTEIIQGDDGKTNAFIHRMTLGGKLKVEMRLRDGFINATRLCESVGKEWNNFPKNQSGRVFITSLHKSMKDSSSDKPTSHGFTTSSTPDGDLSDLDLTGIVEEVRTQHGRGTYVCPKLAIKLVAWLNPMFEVEMADLVERYMKGQITTEESAAVAKDVASSIVHQLPAEPPATLSSPALEDMNSIVTKPAFQLLSPEEQTKIAHDIVHDMVQAKRRRLVYEEQKASFEHNREFYLRMDEMNILDANLKMGLIDNMKNTVLEQQPATAMLTGGEKYMTVTKWLATNYPERNDLQSTAFTMRFGSLMAKKFKNKHSNANTTKIDKLVNGEVRKVNVYDVNNDSALFEEAFSELTQ